MINEYRIHTLDDLKQVPIERLDDCLNDIKYARALHALTHGENESAVEFGPIIWRDDGVNDICVYDDQGNKVLSLEIRKASE